MNRIPGLLLLLSSAALAAGTALPAKWTARERALAKAITAPSLAARIRFLASDLLEGRGPGARGDELAMAYVASEFERMGLQPMGDPQGGGRSWLQTFDIVGLRAKLTAAPTITAGGKSIVLQPGIDMVLGAVEEPLAAKVDAAGACSSATASMRRSRSGTTSRAPTCAARSWWS